MFWRRILLPWERCLNIWVLRGVIACILMDRYKLFGGGQPASSFWAKLSLIQLFIRNVDTYVKNFMVSHPLKTVILTSTAGRFSGIILLKDFHFCRPWTVRYLLQYMTREVHALGLLDYLAFSPKNKICWLSRRAARRKFTAVYPEFFSIVLFCMWRYCVARNVGKFLTTLFHIPEDAFSLGVGVRITDLT
jgi:hypothetical protein